MCALIWARARRLLSGLTKVLTVLCVVLTVLWVVLNVLHVVLTVLNVGSTIMCVALTVSYVALTVLFEALTVLCVIRWRWWGRGERARLSEMASAHPTPSLLPRFSPPSHHH